MSSWPRAKAVSANSAQPANDRRVGVLTTIVSFCEHSASQGQCRIWKFHSGEHGISEQEEMKRTRNVGEHLAYVGEEMGMGLLVGVVSYGAGGRLHAV